MSSAAFTTPERQAVQVDSPQVPAGNRHRELLRIVELSISLFDKDEGVKLSMFRLQKAIIDQLLNPSPDHTAECQAQASKILEMMESNGCNNATSFTVDMRRLHDRIAGGDFDEACHEGLAGERIRTRHLIKI